VLSLPAICRALRSLVVWFRRCSSLASTFGLGGSKGRIRMANAMQTLDAHTRLPALVPFFINIRYCMVKPTTNVRCRISARIDLGRFRRKYSVRKALIGFKQTMIVEFEAPRWQRDLKLQKLGQRLQSRMLTWHVHLPRTGLIRFSQ
jgi:hypothetical protein